MKAFVCVPSVPTRVVPDSAATPPLAMSTLFEPVVRLLPAKGPKATLLLPVVFETSALKPLATLKPPVVFSNSALPPLATLRSQVVRKRRRA